MMWTNPEGFRKLPSLLGGRRAEVARGEEKEIVKELGELR
jgi:hypothetical protein